LRDACLIAVDRTVFR